MARTKVGQHQIQHSQEVDDSLPLGYSDSSTLESDLNYIRSIVRDLKGTVSYDSPLVKNLTELQDTLENLVLNNVSLTGNSVAETPPENDDSTRIATTSFVKQALTGANATDKHKKYPKGTTSTDPWTIVHNMGKKPSVTFEGSDRKTREIGVEYIDDDTLILTFAKPISGTVILN